VKLTIETHGPVFEALWIFFNCEKLICGTTQHFLKNLRRTSTHIVGFETYFIVIFPFSTYGQTCATAATPNVPALFESQHGKKNRLHIDIFRFSNLDIGINFPQKELFWFPS